MNATLLDAKVQELSDETRPVFEMLALAVREASDGEPDLQPQANLAVLLAADALRPDPQPLREQRWRRLVQAVAPLARRSQSTELRRFVAENRDLLVSPANLPVFEASDGPAQRSRAALCQGAQLG